MTNKIKILSPEQAIKIAAGEVVERPANIIKECIENSIDAGANKITIIVDQAGKKAIKIIDNGCGMNPQDAQLCVAQYATSKINTVEDLESIATFGFRGEALASVNAVSNLTITTKTEYDQTGTLLRWQFGKLQEESDIACATGTIIEISNLFDNIPARKKFLKKDETEWRAITSLFQAFCLDYPTIHFQLYQQDHLYYNCPATTETLHRIAQLFDTQLQNVALPLVYLQNTLCKVTGVISDATYYRYDRNQFFIFVNQRLVKNMDLSKAIMRGYAGLLPAQKYPAAIIFIQIAPDQIDVNIHPKKEEIKFLHPKKIEDVIINSIKATLEKTISDHIKTAPLQESIYNTQSAINNVSRRDTANLPAPFSFLQHSPAVNFNSLQPESIHTFHPDQHNLLDTAKIESHKALNDETVIIPDAAAYRFQQPAIPQHINQPEDVTPDKDAQKTLQISELNIIGQYNKTYIMFEKDQNLVFIDQHAAHERILYEQFTNNFNNVATIQLMFPEIIKLATHEVTIINPYLHLLHEHGIQIEFFSSTQLVVQATPIHFKNQDIQQVILEIIGWINSTDGQDYDHIAYILHEKIHAKMACSAAIKAGDILDRTQMQQLLQDLSHTQHRFSCPHGRPTSWVLPVDQIEKAFKRDYTQKAEQLYYESI